MLMLPPVQRISSAERAAARERKTAPAGERAAASETGARVEPVKRTAEAGDPPPRPHRDDKAADRDAASARPGRSHAPLVAQLIATALGLAQTRARRRASVSEALAAYRRVREKPGRPRGSA